MTLFCSFLWLSNIPWWLSGKESACQYRRHKFDPFVRKIPWRRKWQPTLVFLSGESHGQRSLVGYSPCSSKRGGHDLVTKQQQFFYREGEMGRGYYKQKVHWRKLGVWSIVAFQGFNLTVSHWLSCSNSTFLIKRKINLHKLVVWNN